MKISSKFFEAVCRRFLRAAASAAWGFVFGIPAGLLSGAAAAGTCGFVVGLGDGDPFGSAGSWILMALGFWGGLASLYVGALAGGIGGALGGTICQRHAGALAGAVAGGGVGLFHGLQGPPGALGVVAILLSAGTAAGALAGWIGGLASAPSPPTPGGGECLSTP